MANSAPSVMRFADLPIVPWKNGLGTTREILAEPAGPGRDGFAWRLSMASIAADAPFSRYPGIRRHLAVVAGGAVELVVDERTHPLGVGDAAVTFDGGSDASARSLGEPAIDLNLMLDPTAFEGSLEPVAAGNVAIDSGCLILVAVVPLRIRLEAGDSWELGTLDALIAPAVERIVFQVLATSASTTGPLAFAARLRPVVNVR